jgi:peptidase M28-like protein
MTSAEGRPQHLRILARPSILVAVAGGLLLTSAAPLRPHAVGPPDDAAQKWAERLAATEMRGRRTGTPDGDRAARIIADEFRAAGLEPAGEAGTFFQSFTFPFYQLVAPTRLALRSGAGGWRELTYASDYYFLTGSGASFGEGTVVFAGYGLDAAGRRDYADLEVNGRMVLAFDGAPANLDLPASERSAFAKAQAARKRGARGLLLVATAIASPLTRERVWVLRPENYLEGFLLGRVSPTIAAQFVGTEPAALLQRANEPAASGVPLRGEIAWQSSVVFDAARPGANVLGQLTGRDSRLRDEVVILGAHYDGGGIDPDGTVYPGAEDNASGTSVILALARTLAGVPRPARTVVLAAWGAEEQGAWGSRHFVNSHRDLGQIAVTFTLDNVGVGDGKFRLYGATNFPEEWALVEPGIPADLRSYFTARGAGGSDGWTFQTRGIPSFFAHAEAPQLYVHTPDDKPATLTRVSLDHAGRFMASAVVTAANAPASLVSPRRLDRYLARHGFVAGYTRATSPDWAALRKRGFDLVLWDAATAQNVTSLQDSSQVVMVRDRGDLLDSEEGRPLRVLAAQTDGTALTFANGAPAWRRTPGGWQSGDLIIRLVSSPSSTAMDAGAMAGFVLDADTELHLDAITGSLVAAGKTVDEIEALIGGRVREALVRALPSTR